MDYIEEFFIDVFKDRVQRISPVCYFIFCFVYEVKDILCLNIMPYWDEAGRKYAVAQVAVKRRRQVAVQAEKAVQQKAEKRKWR